MACCSAILANWVESAEILIYSSLDSVCWTWLARDAVPEGILEFTLRESITLLAKLVLSVWEQTICRASMKINIVSNPFI